MTLVGAALVDRLGRKILLSVGTLGIIVSLLICGLVYVSLKPSAWTSRTNSRGRFLRMAGSLP